MEKIIQSPGRYIQGFGAISRIGQYVAPLAKHVLVLSDSFVLGLVRDKLETSFLGCESEYVVEVFGGECCHTEINRLLNVLKRQHCDGVVGVGGGKTLDTAKAVSYYASVPLIVVPTIASTDAPCSALSVIYTDSGTFESYLSLSRNPDIVVVDTDIIAHAPARLLAAGIGDAMATYFEARACEQSCAMTIAGGQSTLAAMALARLCYDTIQAEGYKAILAVQKNVVTKAVDKVVEANTYLSGVGFESGGLAAAHAIHNGLTMVPEMHHLYHGEKVAFGTLAQLMLENASRNDLDDVCKLCVSIGLPITFEQLGAKNISEAQLRAVAEAACSEQETMHFMPFEVTSEMVYAALVTADQYGEHFLTHLVH